jgi:hypothetical protein
MKQTSWKPQTAWDAVQWLENKGYFCAAADLEDELKDYSMWRSSNCTATPVDTTECMRKRIELLEAELDELPPVNRNKIQEEKVKYTDLAKRILREEAAYFLFRFQDNTFLKESGVLSARNLRLMYKFSERFHGK